MYCLNIVYLIGKLLDWVILNKSQNMFKTSHQQFGFKSDHSTTMCNFIVGETVNYHNAHNSEVHAVLLDASKAFDRVHFVKLFQLLMSKGCCPRVTRLLIHMYTSRSLTVNGIRPPQMLSQ